MTTTHAELRPPVRTLLGPGPSNVHPAVQQAALAPMTGYLDPAFIKVMQETLEMLRPVFGTTNEITFPLSGTGHAGMEAGVVSLVEPGEKVIVGINGFFGQRLAEVARRAGAQVIPVQGEWGRILEAGDVEKAIKTNAPVKAVAVVQAETSTGVLQPLADIARLAHEHDALFYVDAVTSLGGTEVEVDAVGIDYGYSCTQKCLGSITGMSPVTVGERARMAMARRRTGVGSWYLDLGEAWKYWSKTPVYHHTGPITQVYALHAALGLVQEEGLQNRFRRHQISGDALKAGLEAMGLKLLAQPGHRLCMLTTVSIPDGADDLRVRKALLDEFNLEIGGGLGDLKGKVWRIGLMGYNAQPASVLLALSALTQVLQREGVSVVAGAAEGAANTVFAGAPKGG